MNNIKYTIKENNEIPELAVIEKSNISVDITLGETLKNIEYNKNGITQVEAELKIKKAIITNILEHHPDIDKIDEEKLLAYYLYYEAFRYQKIAEEKLKEFYKAQEELNDEVEEIKKQTKLEKTPIEKNIEVMKAIKENKDNKDNKETK